MKTSGLSLDQAPPLAVPAGFFLLVPLSMAAAGLLLVARGQAVLSTHWSPETLALTHLGTLGLLGSAMLGAFYQFVPVVAGARVPRVGLARGLQPLWLLGVGAFVLGLARGRPGLVMLALAPIFLVLVVFLVQVGLAMARAPGGGPTVAGMKLALLALAVTAFLGIWMAHGHAGARFPGPRPTWIAAHLAVGLLGWVGGLVAAITWTVLPMFFLAPPPPRPLALAAAGGTAATVVLVPALLPFEPSLDTVAAAALPALLAAWLLHPAAWLRALAGRRRPRPEPALRAWQAALLLAPACAAAALAALLLRDPRPPLLLGWLAILGWAGLAVHGMLTRILPFLVWFHRFASLAGRQEVPSVRGLLPDRQAAIGLALHAAALLAGAAAILLGADAAARAAGVALLAAGGWLGSWIVRLVAARPPEPTGAARRAPSRGDAPARG